MRIHRLSIAEAAENRRDDQYEAGNRHFLGVFKTQTLHASGRAEVCATGPDMRKKMEVGSHVGLNG